MTPALLLSLLLSVSPQERLALIRLDPSGRPGKPLDLLIQAGTGAAADCLGQTIASDRSFLKVKGSKPLRFAFALDLDGDGLDELCAVREHVQRSDRRMELGVYRSPEGVNGNTGKPLARSRGDSLGRGKGSGRLHAIGPIDQDGDGTDELLVVRSFHDGRQSLEIRTPPRAGRKRVGPVLASLEQFGAAGSDDLIGLFGADTDADGKDEIVSVRRDGFGSHQVLVHEAPLAPGQQTGTLLADAPDLLPQTIFRQTAVLGAHRVDLEGDGTDELLVLLEDSEIPFGRWLAVFPIPTHLVQDLGMPVLYDLTLSGELPGRSALFVASLRVDEELPDLSGNFDMHVLAYSPGGGGWPGYSEWIGPFPDMAISRGGNMLTLSHPSGTDVTGPLVAEGLIHRIVWPAVTAELFAAVDGGVIRAGDRIVFEHGPAWFAADGNEINIECQGAFQPIDPCGTVTRDIPGVGEVWVGNIARIRLVRSP